MIAELTLWGFVWYYFNIIGISAIIFLVMMIAYNRAKRTVINIGEGSTKESKFPVFIKQIAIFGILFFAVREWGNEIYEATEPLREFIGGKIDG